MLTSIGGPNTPNQFQMSTHSAIHFPERVVKLNLKDESDDNDDFDDQLPRDYRHHESAEVVESEPDPVVDLEVKEGKNHNNVMQKQTQPMDIEVLDPSVSVPSLRRSKRTPKPIDKLNL
ncbi:hypothetical protein RN001_006200 [Aquatica leii]|uniref:Uncharacterized protein n=1 Tax=Aquatica leii TaxID=1421715 RepID=A0AAN7PI85_9COLE|nr:hypothetical protein RN001_006200 [Aquatica leii]